MFNSPCPKCHESIWHAEDCRTSYRLACARPGSLWKYADSGTVIRVLDHVINTTEGLYKGLTFIRYWSDSVAFIQNGYGPRNGPSVVMWANEFLDGRFIPLSKEKK